MSLSLTKCMVKVAEFTDSMKGKTIDQSNAIIYQDAVCVGIM